MKCDNCPAFWVAGGGGYEYPDEIDSLGCFIYGEDIGGEGCSCNLKKHQVEAKLKQLEDYEHGKIERPQWLANRFIREMDRAIATFPYFPPKRPKIRTFESECEGTVTYAEKVRVISECDLHYEKIHAYRKGYEDAKNGKPENPEYWRSADKEEAEIWDILD